MYNFLVVAIQALLRKVGKVYGHYNELIKMVKIYSLVILILLSFLSLPVHKSAAQATSVSSASSGVHLVSSDQTGIVVEVLAPSYEIVGENSSQSGFEKIQIPGFENASSPGEPQLPVKGILLGVPPTTELELLVIDDEVQMLNREVNLARNPMPARLGQDLSPGEMVSIPAPTPETKVVPRSAVRLAADAWIRDQRIVTLQISPIQYNASDSTLLWHKRMLVKLRFVTDEADTGELQPSAWHYDVEETQHSFEGLYATSLLNYEQARVWRSKPAQTPTRSDLISQNQDVDVLPRIKITVNEDGIYELTYDDLEIAGFDIDNIDPGKLHLTNQGQDVAIHLYGQEDGTFDPGDAIRFYGRKFHGDLLAQSYSLQSTNWMTYTHALSGGTFGLWHPEFNAIMMEKYTDENVYWLQVGDSNGLRMENISVDYPGALSTPTYFTETVHVEQSHEWYTHNFSSEDTWFWDRIRTATSRTYTATLEKVATVPVSATLRAEVVARSASSAHQPDHHTRFYINDDLDPIDDQYWHGISRYSYESKIPQSSLVDGTNSLKLEVLLDAYTGQVSDDIYFDWFEVEYARLFEAVENQLFFSRDEQASAWKYEIAGFTDNEIQVYDVTDPFQPKIVTNTTVNSGQVTFESSHDNQVDYYVFGSSAIQKPSNLELRPATGLQSPMNSADYLFISHRDFITATQTLADHRSSQGYATMVIDVEDVYDAFNYGIINPIAIKNLLASAYNDWQAAPAYVLLVGDGHWNPKGFQSNDPKVNYLSQTPVYIPPNLSWVDPWQGEVDSTSLLAAVVGDDPLPDYHIGRLPVNSVDELNAVIDKIIAYENSSYEDWHYHVMFIADNSDLAGNFSNLADGIIDSRIPAGFQVDRLYFDDYLQLSNPKDSINEDIKQGLNDPGVLLLNYIGHASIDRWAHESILTSSDISDLANGTRLPVLLSMDCLDGYWLHPSFPGLVEDLLRAENKGIVSAFSPTGLGVATGHDALHRGFYQAIFQSNVKKLGPATLAGKLALFATGSNYDLLHTFVIFGDPALDMKIPAPPVYLPVTMRIAP